VTQELHRGAAPSSRDEIAAEKELRMIAAVLSA
jgi:hypothetical protein